MMEASCIPYPLATDSWGEEEKKAAIDVINSGFYSMGKHVEAFESQFADFFGAKYAVMVNSGSSANLLAVAAMFYHPDYTLLPGDEVIVPAVSWSTTYFPIQQYGLKLVFVDVDLETLNLNADHLESALTDKTKAIMLPHILGNPADIVRIKDFCEKHDLFLIEDTCESMGATVDGRYLGTFGHCGTFSLFFSHHISAMEGGVITTDDEAIYHLLLSLRSHGWTRHLPENNTLCEKHSDPFYESFRFILPGYNLRPLEISAAVAKEQLKKLPGFIQMRLHNAEYFQSVMKEKSILTQAEKYGISSWFGFSMILPDDAPCRLDMLAALARHQIQTRPIVSGNFTRNEVMSHLNYRIVGDLNAADRVHSHGFFIGNQHTCLKNQIRGLGDVLEEVMPLCDLVFSRC